MTRMSINCGKTHLEGTGRLRITGCKNEIFNLVCYEKPDDFPI